MPPIEIRPFRRSDRDQVTALVNAHIEAVLPGVSVSANAVLSRLEREPGEYLVDPGVVARDPHQMIWRTPKGRAPPSVQSQSVSRAVRAASLPAA